METFLETLVRGVMLGGVYALLAVGLVILFKSSRILNLGYGFILMLLAYLFCTFYIDLRWPAAASIVLVFVVAALLGLALDRFVFRRLIGQPIFSTIMLTLVLGIMILEIAKLSWERTYSPGLIPSTSIHLGTVAIPQSYLWSFVIALSLFGLLVLMFQRSRIGLAMRSVAEDHQLSQSMGISVKMIFAVSWAVSCVVAAVGGILLAHTFPPVDATGLSGIGLAKALPVVLLGGLESIPGALLGGLIIGIVIQFADLKLGMLAGSTEIIALIVMLLILLIRPHGLFGLRTIERI